MDFLTNAMLYLLLCVCLWVIYQIRGMAQVAAVPVNLVWRFIRMIIPLPLRNLLNRLTHWLLFERHCLYQIIYILVVLGGHCILFSQVIPVLYRYSDRENHLFLVLALLFCNGFCYTMVCMTDPGVISPRNFPVYSQVYVFDHVIYAPKECLTCPHIIPARARHCSRCDHCVFRFEHHCVWTNCCIGGENYSHFLLFIASSLAMVVNALRLEIRMLCDHTEHERLWSAQYLDQDGEAHDMSWPTLIQHLFMSFPLVVAMAAVLCIIGLFLGGYTAFHAWLVCTNQTSYEYSRNRRCSTQLTTTKTNRKIVGDGGHFINLSHSTHPYDRGTWSNLCEIFGFSVRNSLRELRRQLPVQMDFKTH
ncbi:probable palmitoyltransferase ZDHHC4 [Clonorchis sinensis]|uniref:Palmitoyltransferase n=1 Tax=Clonorchis sinensis TaxID=79923 RepID=G7YLF5_CLOSI|nr:probable palmitoyltransferase ZDHHC4 [Clonorchis sinensis]